MILRTVSGLFKQFLASQLRKPSGWPVGWITLARLNRWNRKMNRSTFEAMALRGDEHVLELGFGGGDLLRLMAEKLPSGRMSGVDWSPVAVRYCRNYLDQLIADGKLELHCEDVAKLPLADNSVDYICAVNTVYFWDDPKTVFAECARVLVNGGHLLLCNADLSDLDPSDYPPEYFTSHSLDDISENLESLGFTRSALDFDEDEHARFYILSAVLVT